MITLDRFLAIDFGSSYLKGMLFHKTLSGLEVIRTEILPVIILDTDEIDPLEYNLIRFVQSFFPEEKKILMNISPESVYIREANVPLTNEKAMKEILPFEMENSVPFPMEEMEALGKIWRKNEKESSNLVCFNVHKNEIHKLIKPFNVGELHINCLSIDNFTISKISSDQNCLQIDIGGKYTLINLISNGFLRLARVLPFGGEHITQELMKLWKWDRQIIEDLKQNILSDLFKDESFTSKEINLKPNQWKDLKTILIHEISEIVREIDNTLLSLVDDEKPEIAILTGGSSQWIGLEDYLSHQINLVVTRPSLGINPSFATVYSMGVHYSGSDKLDFLDTKSAKELSKSPIQWKTFLPHGIIFSLSMFVLILVYFTGIFIDQKRISGYKKILSEKFKSSFGVELSEDENAVAIASSKLKTEKKKTEIYRLFLSQASILDSLQELTENFPNAEELPFVLEQFNFEGNEIQIYGRINEFSELGIIQSRLEKSPLFSNIQILNKRLIAGANKLKVSFKLKLDIVPTKEDP